MRFVFCALCLPFCLFNIKANGQTAFITPDTVCVNEPVKITNTSSPSSSYYWNFCIADLNIPPEGVNLGNIDNKFASPVFIDYAYYNNRYYGFLVNYEPGALIRLDFGSSLLNTPSPVDLGNFNGILLPQAGSEGIQIVMNEGKWYALILTGTPVPGNSNRIIKIEFGADLGNPSPVATNWGNIGNMLQPIDLHVFKEGNNWYGFTLNAENNTITRFNFTSSFDNTPTGINLNNIGNLSYPTGIYAINDNTNWHVFIVNAGDHTRSKGPFSLTRLDFGSSLLNMPTGVNLGNPGNLLQHPRDLTIMKSCGQIMGFAVNGHLNDRNIVKLNFNNNLTAIPTITSLGNIGNLSFPHSISKLFRVGNDIYTFITNVDTKTLTRLRFPGCLNSTVPSSTLKDPPLVYYNSPGIYNINLTTDEGLPSQSAYCRNVVVVPKLQHTALKNILMCPGDSVLLASNFPTRNKWNNGSTVNSLYIKTPGMYWVESRNGGCINVDSFNVTLRTTPFQVNLGADRSICKEDTAYLDALNPGSNYKWQNGYIGQVFKATEAGTYSVAVTKNGCIATDTIVIAQNASPQVAVSNDTIICDSGEALLKASGGINYNWYPEALVEKVNEATTKVHPISDTKFFVTVTGSNGCASIDSVNVKVKSKSGMSLVSSKTTLCSGDTALLSVTGGDSYTWNPQSTLSDPFSNITYAFPSTTTKYQVILRDNYCGLTDSLSINLPVVLKPAYTVSKSNDINCQVREATLTATGGTHYSWSPVTGLSDPTIRNPKVNVNTTTTYHVKIRSEHGCEVEDSIQVRVNEGGIANNLRVPNIFTPNNDLENDCFSLKHWGAVADFSLMIFNRWGQLVFKTNNSTDCWNGKLNGVEQPVGGYGYVVKAKTNCGNVFYKGIVLLIR